MKKMVSVELINPEPERTATAVSILVRIAAMQHWHERALMRQKAIAAGLRWGSGVCAAAALGLVAHSFINPEASVRWWVWALITASMLMFEGRLQLIARWTRQLDAMVTKLDELSAELGALAKKL